MWGFVFHARAVCTWAQLERKRGVIHGTMCPEAGHGQDMSWDAVAGNMFASEQIEPWKTMHLISKVTSASRSPNAYFSNTDF